ncbi:MAG: hypothetical protein ACYTFQ_03320 [Planctomycetota bacterium]|jgi:hypothetical protein
MNRKQLMAAARRQETDARCINNTRGMARHGKKLGAKRVREMLKKDLEKRNPDG